MLMPIFSPDIIGAMLIFIDAFAADYFTMRVIFARALMRE